MRGIHDENTHTHTDNSSFLPARCVRESTLICGEASVRQLGLISEPLGEFKPVRAE